MMGHYHPNIHLENNLNSMSTADNRNSGGGETNHAAKNSKNTKNTKKKNNQNNDVNNHDNNNNNNNSSSACELTMMNQPSDNILSSRVFIEKINESHKPFLKLLLSDEAVMREISTRSVIRMDQFEAVFGPTFKHLVQHNEQERFNFSDSDNNTPTPADSQKKKHPMTMTWWILRTRGTKGLGAIGLHRDIENRCITVEQLVRPEIQNTTIAAEALYTLTKVYEDLNRLNGTLRDFYDYKLIVTSSVGRSMTDLMQAFQFEKKMIPSSNRGEQEKLQYETKTGHFFSNVVYRAKSQLIQQVEYISLPRCTTTAAIDNGEKKHYSENDNDDNDGMSDDDENGENDEKGEMMIAPDRIDLIRYTQVQGRRLNPFPYRGLIQFEFDNTWKREKMVHQLPALGCNKQHSIGHVTLRIPTTTTSHTSERNNNNNGDGGGDDDEYHSKIQNWLDCYLCVYLVKEASSSSSAQSVANNKPSIIYQAKRNKRDGYPLVFSQFGFKRSSNNSNKNDLISEIKLQPKSQSLDENGKHARVFCLIELWHHLTKLDQFETDHFYTHSEDRRKKSMNSSSSSCNTTTSSAAAVHSSGSSPPRAASSISTSYAHNTNSHYGMKKNASSKSKNRSMDASNMMNVGNNSGGANHALSAPIAIVQPPGLNIKNMSIPSVNVSGVGANNHNPMVIVGGTSAAHGHQAANSTSGSPPKQQHSPRSPVLSNNNHSHLFNHFGYDTNDGISLDIHNNGNHSNYGYHHSNHGNNNGSNGSNYLRPYQQPSHRMNNGGHYSGGPVAASAQRDYNNHHQHLHPNHAHAAPHMHVHTHHAHQHQHNGSVVDNAHHHVHHHHHHNNYQNQSYCSSRHHHHHFQWSDMTSELTCSHHDHCQVPMNNHEQDNCSMMKDDNDSSSSRSSFSSASFSSNKAPLHLILGLANENEMESNSGRNFKCPCPWNTRNNPPYHVLLNALPPPSICSSNSCCPSIIAPSSSSTCLAPSSCSSSSTTTSPPALSSPSSPPTSATTGVDAFHAHHSHPQAHHRSDPLCCPIPAPTPTLAVNCSSIAAPHGLQQQQPQLINTEKVTSPSTGILPSIQSLLHMVDHHSTAPVSVTNVASQSQMSPPTGDPSTPLTPFASLRISCAPPTNAPSAHYQSEPFVPHSHAIAHHHMDKNHHPMMHHPQPYGQQNVHHGAPHNHFPQQNHYKYMKQ